MNLSDLFLTQPYALDKKEKKSFLISYLKQLTKLHIKGCPEYKKIQAINSSQKNINDLSELLFIPVRLFKQHQLKSVPSKNIIKTLTSSGTTSQVVSKIFLDKNTAMLQTKALVNIMTSFLGPKRLPMLIVDSPSVIKDRKSFSARGAGILGMMNFGRNHTYALHDDMTLNLSIIQDFLEKHKDGPILIFGFTFMIWQYFYKLLKNENITLDITNGILIHSGGWKKIESEGVDNITFKKSLFTYTKMKRIHNFYGMVEQVGSIFMECESGNLHAPNFSDVIFRDENTLLPLNKNQKGIIEVLSVLPHSYPGHVLITEDIGELLGEDDCLCGRNGKYFKIYGRLPKSETRGCSDTHAEETNR